MDQTRQPGCWRRALRSKKSSCILTDKMAELKYRGRVITEAHLLYIRELIAAHPEASRRRLSQKLCEAWQWRQANGALSDMLCRSLLVMLERSGQIRLPPVTYVRHNPLAKRARPAPLLMDTTPIECELRDLGPVEFQLIRRTAEEPLFNSLLEQHHYLGYEQPVGEHLKYLLWGRSRPIACLAWSSAPRHLGARDRYIGWSPAARRQNIRFIAYNLRYLLVPWVRVKHLASQHSGPHGRMHLPRLGKLLRSPSVLSRDLRGSGAIPRDLLLRSELGMAGGDHRSRQGVEPPCS